MKHSLSCRPLSSGTNILRRRTGTLVSARPPCTHGTRRRSGRGRQRGSGDSALVSPARPRPPERPRRRTRPAAAMPRRGRPHPVARDPLRLHGRRNDSPVVLHSHGAQPGTRCLIAWLVDTSGGSRAARRRRRRHQATVRVQPRPVTSSADLRGTRSCRCDLSHHRSPRRPRATRSGVQRATSTSTTTSSSNALISIEAR